jgi:hypothetical protein
MPDDPVSHEWQELLPHEVATRLELALLRHGSLVLAQVRQGRLRDLAELLAGTALGGSVRVLRPIRAPHPHRSYAWPSMGAAPPPASDPEGPDGETIVPFPRPHRPPPDDG